MEHANRDARQTLSIRTGKFGFGKTSEQPLLQI